MPRTKISKSKRNRDAAKEEREEIKNERLRQFDLLVDQIEQEIQSCCNDLIEEFTAKMRLAKLQLTSEDLSLNLYDFLNKNKNERDKKIVEVNSKNITRSDSTPSLAPTLSTLSQTSCTKISDEGYLTESSANSRSSNQLRLPIIPTSIGRNPGPLSSAKARPRPRRSRSATGTFNIVQKRQPHVQSNEHISRSKLRTPLLQQNSLTRSKAISADRCSALITNMHIEASPILRRWAKPGETVISLSGSPIVMSMVPDSVTNVNIPTKNGVFSLRSKRCDPTEIGKQIAQDICPETLQEMKQLQAHLDVIMSFVGKN